MDGKEDNHHFDYMYNSYRMFRPDEFSWAANTWREDGAMNSFGLGMFEILGIFVGFYSALFIIAALIENHKRGGGKWKINRNY